jgi:CHAT domain-containing protein/tetratricopeptide (TPR) repeat protein
MAAGYAVSPGGPDDLTQGISRTRSIATGEVHRYRARLAERDVLHVRVDQGGDEHGLDVEVRLTDPAGREAALADGVSGGRWTEELAVVAPSSGSYLLAIKAGTGAGTYRLDVIALRPSHLEDTWREEALKLDQEAAILDFQDEDPPRQLNLRRRALELWRRLADPVREAQELYHLGWLDFNRGEPLRAAELFRQSADLWVRAEVPIEQARMINDLGRALRQARRREEARQALDFSLQQAESLGDRWLQADCLYYRGGLAIDQDELEAGVRDLERSLQLSRSLGDPQRIALTLNELGFAYREQERFDEAIRSYEEALQKTPLKWLEATLHNELGGLYNDLGNRDEAIRHYERAVDLNRQIGRTGNNAKTLNNLALAYQGNGDFRRALALFQQALDTGELDAAAQAKTLINMAFLQIELGRPREALRLAGDARPHAAEETAGAILEAEGSALLRLGDLPAARRHLEQALALSRGRRDRSREAGVKVLLGKVAWAEGDLYETVEHARQAVAVVESLRTGVDDETLRATLLASRLNPYELYVGALVALGRAAPGRGHEAESLRINEMARARSLLDLLGDASLPTGREDGNGTTPGVRLPTDSAGQYRPLTAAEIQSQVLGPGTVLLEYTLGRDRSYVWAVTPGSLEVFDLPPRQEIETIARRYYEQLRARVLHPHAPAVEWVQADRQADSLAAQLAQILLQPAAGRLEGARTVLVVADGALQYIPFAALPLPSGSVRMIEEHEIVQLPSASVLAVLRRDFENRERPTGTLALFADPVFEREDTRFAGDAAAPEAGLLARFFPPRRTALRQAAGLKLVRLRWSDREADAILRLVPRSQSFEARGFEASVPKVLATPLERYRFLHFATHGLIDSAHPERSSLVLSQYDAQGNPIEGRLSLADIYNLRLNADLVVLSACETALGREIRGEGLIGLTRGFMYAGSRRVLASLWSVDDQVTAKLMERFYRAMLEEGRSPAAALRQAQIEMLSDPKHHAPYFWAGFSLQGEWR